jgi:hypothetical protein
MEYAHYLIAEKGADISEPYSIVIKNTDQLGEPTHYPITSLREWLPVLNKDGHKIKM